LNQIEMWFSILVRKLLKRGSLSSRHYSDLNAEGFIVPRSGVQPEVV
jgi:hypothetical protein